MSSKGTFYRFLDSLDLSLDQRNSTAQASMSLPNTQFFSQPSGSHSASTELTDDNILVAVASQFSKLLQAHKISVAQTDISSEDMVRVDAVKQAAIAKIILLLTAYYRTQGWNPQDIKTSVLNMLDQQQS